MKETGEAHWETLWALLTAVVLQSGGYRYGNGRSTTLAATVTGGVLLEYNTTYAAT
jgi:hypothetical protein